MVQKTKEGPISETELMQSLINAKKVMNKVDNGDFSRGNIKESNMSQEQVEEIMAQPPSNQQQNTVNIEKINSSNLPDAIKEAMINNPIEQIKLNDTVNMDFIGKAKKLMEQEGLNSKKEQGKSFTSRKAPTQQNTGDLIKMLEPVIENIVRKTINEVLDAKLTQLLTAQQTMSINENLAIKVGDSLFQGKITKVKNLK